VLSVVLATAQRDGLIRSNPCTRVRRPRPDTPEAAYLSVDQVKAVLSGAPKDLRPLLALMSLTGLRIGEVLALSWADVDLEGGTLAVRYTLTQTDAGLMRQSAKTRASQRVLPLVPAAVEALKDQRKVQAEVRLRAGAAWHDHDLVFTTGIGTPEHYRNVLRRYQAVSKPLGISGGFHGLRHSAGTMLITSESP